MKIFYTRNNAYDTLIVDDNGEIRFLTENNEFPKDDSEIEAFVQAVEDWSSWEEFVGTIDDILEGNEVIFQMDTGKIDLRSDIAKDILMDKIVSVLDLNCLTDGENEYDEVYDKVFDALWLRRNNFSSIDDLCRSEMAQEIVKQEIATYRENHYMDYVVMTEYYNSNGDVIEAEWEDSLTLNAAKDRADYLYSHIADVYKDCSSVFVIKTVNPNPEAENHIDGDTVYNPAVGEFADMLGDFLGCTLSATTLTIAGVEKSGYLGGTDEMFDGDEFYQIFADETGAYKVYFEYSGQPVDEINYSKAYRAESYDTSWDEVREMMEKLHLC